MINKNVLEYRSLILLNDSLKNDQLNVLFNVKKIIIINKNFKIR